MNEIEMVGMRTLGNTKLLTESRARIGVFASRDTDPAIDIIREQWAMQKGKQRKCIVGTFHSKAECEILYFVLSRGGSAVWFLGCALPERLPHFFKEAVRKKQLLVVSCFNCEHHSYECELETGVILRMVVIFFITSFSPVSKFRYKCSFPWQLN